MSTQKPSIYIDITKFTLLAKNSDIAEYELINISSTTIIGTVTNFYVYRSKSQGGFWRLYMRLVGSLQFYKGADYAQQTFIHLKLQQFIEENIDNIEEEKYIGFDYFTTEIENKEDISYKARKIDACIFDEYNKDENNLCGKKNRRYR